MEEGVTRMDLTFAQGLFFAFAAPRRGGSDISSGKTRELN